MQCYSLYGMCKKYLETVVLVLTSMVIGMEFHSEGGEIQQVFASQKNFSQRIFDIL